MTELQPFILAYPNTDWAEDETARCDVCSKDVSPWDMYTDTFSVEVCQWCVYHKRIRKAGPWEVDDNARPLKWVFTKMNT